MNKIKLKAQDSVIIESDMEIAKFFGLISNLLQHFDDLYNDQIVDLIEVDSTVLRRMLDWAEHHINEQSDQRTNDVNSIEEPVGVNKKLTDIITDWEKNFLKVDIGTLFLYLRAANYLEIDGLSDIIVRVIANMLIGKSADEIRRKFYEIEKNKLPVI